MRKVITSEEFNKMPIGHIVCDMHYGHPFDEKEMTTKEIEVPIRVVNMLIRASQGVSHNNPYHGGTMNKYLVVVSRDTITLCAYTYDGKGYLMSVEN